MTATATIRTPRAPRGINSFETDTDPETRRTFYTASGWLSAYAYACGYMESVELGDTRLQLWAEGACIHVRAHDDYEGRLFWDSFDTIAEARVRFVKAYRELIA